MEKPSRRTLPDGELDRAIVKLLLDKGPIRLPAIMKKFPGECLERMIGKLYAMKKDETILVGDGIWYVKEKKSAKDLEIVIRKEKKPKKKSLQQMARAAGLVRYFTGEPCRNGHIAERSTVSGACVECSKLYDKNKSRKKTEESLAA